MPAQINNADLIIKLGNTAISGTSGISISGSALTDISSILSFTMSSEYYRTVKAIL